ncbi:MAG: redoxin domain-containing protein [Phycisphaerales bacterium]|nr:MAG: redoxin domain-containing protein [Phycisphaerales bacterium]
MATLDRGNQGARWAVGGLLLVLGGPVMYALLFDVPLMRATGAPAFALIAAGAAAGVVGLRRNRRGWVRVAGGASVIALALAVYMFFVLAALPDKADFAQLEEAPDFTLPDSAGQPASLSKLTSSGPVLLVFYRGYW